MYLHIHPNEEFLIMPCNASPTFSINIWYVRTRSQYTFFTYILHTFQIVGRSMLINIELLIKQTTLMRLNF